MAMIRYHAALQDLMVSVDSIRPDPMNANNGDTDEIIKSIQVNGCFRPIYVSAETGMIVAGHHLYAALMEMGAQRVPVLYVDGGVQDNRRLLIADNRIAALGRDDPALLLNLLDYLNETEGGIEGTGYTLEQVDDLRALMEPEGVGGGFSVPDPLPDPVLHECPACHHQWLGGCTPPDSDPETTADLTDYQEA